MSIRLKKSGFTLLELLVSVVLMLILVGAVIMVFKNSSEVFSRSDARIAVYQNARVTLDMIAKELTSADNGGSSPKDLIIKNPTATTGDQTILHFRTTTSWIDGSGDQKSGTAEVKYILRPTTTDSTLWNILRQVIPTSGGALPEEILGQYVPVDADTLKIGYFTYASTNWNYQQSSHTFKSTDDPALPDAIRITIHFVDRQKQIGRTLSRVIWLPKSISS